MSVSLAGSAWAALAVPKKGPDPVAAERQQLVGAMTRQRDALLDIAKKIPQYKPMADDLSVLIVRTRPVKTPETLAQARLAYEQWQRRVEPYLSGMGLPGDYSVVESRAGKGPVTAEQAAQANKGRVTRPVTAQAPADWRNRVWGDAGPMAVDDSSVVRSVAASARPAAGPSVQQRAARIQASVRHDPTPVTFRRSSAAPPFADARAVPVSMQDSLNEFGRVWGRAGDSLREHLNSAVNAVTGLLRLPLQTASYVTSKFGMRLNPVTKVRSLHAGVDYAARQGTAVQAAGDGVVTDAREMGGYGNAVIVNHGNGLQTLYGHLSSYGVVPGQRVRAGMVIANTGATGRVTGPHLHYEMRRNGVPFDPLGA